MYNGYYRRVRIERKMFLRLFPASSMVSAPPSDMGDSSGSGTDFLASGESVEVERGW